MRKKNRLRAMLTGCAAIALSLPLVHFGFEYRNLPSGKYQLQQVKEGIRTRTYRDGSPNVESSVKALRELFTETPRPLKTVYFECGDELLKDFTSGGKHLVRPSYCEMLNGLDEVCLGDYADADTIFKYLELRINSPESPVFYVDQYLASVLFRNEQKLFQLSADEVEIHRDILDLIFDEERGFYGESSRGISQLLLLNCCRMSTSRTFCSSI